MIISESAKIYAKALLDNVNSDTKISETILSDLKAISDIILSSNDLLSILNAPTISIDKKNLIINDIFSDKILVQILNLLKLLAENSNIALLPQIIEAYQNQLDDIKNIKRVTVISAIDLDDTQKNKIVDKLSDKLNKNIIANWQINTDIIGGLIINFDDTIIDSSIKNKLEKIKGSI